MENEIIEVDVSGVRYSLLLDDIRKFPGTFLECMIKKEWSKGDEVISIARDGKVFKYIYAYMISGQLPRDRNGLITLDAETLEAVKTEADFFGLEELSKDCDHHQKSTVVSLQSYMTMRSYIEKVKDRMQNDFSVEYFSTSEPSELLSRLSEVWCPFCETGDVNSYAQTGTLFKGSTIHNLDMEELLIHATQSAFGHGTETVTDTSVRNSFEIPASQLDRNCLSRLQQYIELGEFAPHRQLELRPYKLVIYQEGGHFDAHRDTVRGEGHIGTLVVILNSEYTGGELVVTHGGRSETVAGAYSWVAMYGDCMHQIHPVTSGTRVSLIYDIYTKEPISVALLPTTPPDVTLPAPANENTLTLAQFVPDVDAFTSSNTTVNIEPSAYNLENASQDSDSNSEQDPSEDGVGYNDDDGEDYDSDLYSANNDIHDHFYDPDYKTPDQRLWQKHNRYPQQTDSVTARSRGISDSLGERVIVALNQELKDWEVIIITCTHLYPECQTSPTFLKGGDRALYELLSEQYEVQVVAATILRRHDPEFSMANAVHGSLFSPSRVEQALGLHNNTSDPTNNTNTTNTSEPLLKKRRVHAARTKLVIPNLLNSDHVLDYSPYQAYTGNESQAEETVYIVAGLQVQKRV